MYDHSSEKRQGEEGTADLRKAVDNIKAGTDRLRPGPSSASSFSSPSFIIQHQRRAILLSDGNPMLDQLECGTWDEVANAHRDFIPGPCSGPSSILICIGQQVLLVVA